MKLQLIKEARNKNNVVAKGWEISVKVPEMFQRNFSLRKREMLIFVAVNLNVRGRKTAGHCSVEKKH